MNKQRPNSGVLFKNDKKETERHPDYVGVIDVNGTELSLSAWVKQGPKTKFLSISVTPKIAAASTASTKNADPFDDAAGF
jgi:hypothetical protein